MKSDDLYLMLGKRPQAVSLALKRFGHSIPSPTLKDVVNAYIAHGPEFAEELERQLGFSSFDGNDVTALLDGIVKVSHGVSIAAEAGKAITTGKPQTAAKAQEETEPEKIFGINKTLFIISVIVLILIILVAIFKK